MTRTAAIEIMVVALLALHATACASSRTSEPAILSSTRVTDEQGSVITGDMIGRGRGEMVLSAVASDPAYGYSEDAPILIGGGFGEGADRTYKYLNALRATTGERVSYNRIGTCCPFKSPNSPFGGEALLEVFEIVIPGSNSAKRMYFNWYDQGETLIPVGLSSAP